MTPRRTGRAFTLLELMMVISMLGVLALMAGQLFNSLMRLNRESQKTQSLLGRWDHATRQLRRDVWGADEFTVVDPRHLTLHVADGPDVHWLVIDPRGTLVRRVGGEEATTDERVWTDLSARVSFEAEGAAVVVTGPPRPNGERIDVRLVSELRLLREATR